MGRNVHFLLADLFRQSVYSRLAGYEDSNDVERLAADPTFRKLALRARRETSVALTSTLHWFKTGVLTKERNQQEQSAYNGHFESVCYDPLFVFNPDGDCLAATLRPVNVHSADGWDDVLLPIIDRYRAHGQSVVVRADAALALPALQEALEQRGVRQPLVRYRSFQYQAAPWDRPRRVIAKVEHYLGELFPRAGFIVTTLAGTDGAVVRSYRQHGTAKQWIKEGKAATHWTRCSCHRFRVHAVRLPVGVIAYNLDNLPAGSSCLSPSRPGPSHASSGGCSGPVAPSSGTPDPSCCSWPRAT